MEKKLSLQLADTIMRRFPHPDNYPFNSWTYSQGFMLFGFIHLYESTGESKYRDYVLKYADFHVSPDGELYRFTGGSMDDMLPGAVIVWAHNQTGEERYKKASYSILCKFAEYPRIANGGFMHARGLVGQMWVDGVFMGGMFLNYYEKMIGCNGVCYEELEKQLEAIFGCCHKKGGLLYHGYSESEDTPWANRLTGKSTDVWSEGLGWYALILAETARMMPETYPYRKTVCERLEMLLNTLSELADKQSGLFYQVVDKGENPDNWTDTSGSAMFLYAFAAAVKLGIGDAAKYQQVIDKCYHGVLSKCIVNADGLVDVYDACDGLGVQNNYDAYITFPKTVNAKEAVAAVLWASEVIECR